MKTSILNGSTYWVSFVFALSGIAVEAGGREYDLEELSGHWAGEVEIYKVNPFTPCYMDIWKIGNKVEVYITTLIGVHKADEVKIDGRTMSITLSSTGLGRVSILGKLKGDNQLTFIFEVGFYTGYGVLKRVKKVELFEDEDIVGQYEGRRHSSMVTDPIDLSLDLQLNRKGKFSGSIKMPNMKLEITKVIRQGNSLLIHAENEDGETGTMMALVEDRGRLMTAWNIGPGSAGGYMTTQDYSMTSSSGDTYVENDRLEFSLTDINGESISLTDDAHSGKVVLVDIWGTWCPPCLEEVPHLVRLYDKYEKQGLRIVAVAMENSDYPEVRKAQLEAFGREHGVRYSVIDGRHGDEKIEEIMKGLKGFRAYPTTIVIGRDGKVRDVLVGYGDSSAARLDSIVPELLNE